MLSMMRLPWVRAVYGFDWEKDHVDQTTKLLENALSQGVSTPFFVEVGDIRTVTNYNQGLVACYWTGMAANPTSNQCLISSSNPTSVQRTSDVSIQINQLTASPRPVARTGMPAFYQLRVTFVITMSPNVKVVLLAIRPGFSTCLVNLLCGLSPDTPTTDWWKHPGASLLSWHPALELTFSDVPTLYPTRTDTACGRLRCNRELDLL
jgi:hypothetical protein